MSVAALILGICALVFAIFGFIPAVAWFQYIALVLGIGGIILGALGIKSRQKKGMAITGLVLSIVAVVIFAILLCIGLCVVSTVSNGLRYYY